MRVYKTKTVFQYDIKGNFIKKWDSLMNIERELGFAMSFISQCCNKHKKFAKGYIWSFKKNDIKIFDLKCICCDKEIIYNPKARNQRYCSTKCKRRSRHKRCYIPVERFMGTCLECRKDFEGYKNKRFCSLACSWIYSYRKNRDDEDFLNKHRIYIKKWYQENKQKHNKNILKDSKKNKAKWNERRFTNINKERILKLLPKECHLCKKKNPTIIHHEKYDFPKKDYNRRDIKERDKYLDNYVKSLLVFCSRKCHMRSHRKDL